MGTMLMGISTQIFHTSKAGVIVIAAMFVIGFVVFKLQANAMQHKEKDFAKKRILHRKMYGMSSKQKIKMIIMKTKMITK